MDTERVGNFVVLHDIPAPTTGTKGGLHRSRLLPWPEQETSCRASKELFTLTVEPFASTNSRETASDDNTRMHVGDGGCQPPRLRSATHSSVSIRKQPPTKHRHEILQCVATNVSKKITKMLWQRWSYESALRQGPAAFIASFPPSPISKTHSYILPFRSKHARTTLWYLLSIR
jgi:hypothetical protein